MVYLFVAITIVGVVSAQLMLKKGLLEVGFVPTQLTEFLPFFVKAFTNIYVLAALLCVTFASLSWLVAISKSSLGHVYPLIALEFMLVPLLSTIVFKESISIAGWIGIACIIIGVFLVLRTG